MRDRIRIFVSSPGDVVAPREVAAQTIERLAQDFARFFAIEAPYLWQNEPLDASRHFQDDIEPPSTFDVVVLILQQRLGTPLPAQTGKREYRGIDGRTPVTGTEWEYEEALRGARENGAPDLLVYRSRSQASVDSWDAKKRDEQLRQLAALDSFWKRHFVDKGMFLGAFTEFRSLEEFASIFETHLRQLLKRRIEQRARHGADQPDELWTHPPFRGLESYELEHARIFFGQDDAVSRAMLQLAANAQAGAAFLLILGASGSGKSSLAKAGIVPKLFVPRRIPGAAFLRRAVFRPSETREAEDVFDALARAFVAARGPGEGLPELVGREQTLAELAGHFRDGGGNPAYPIAMVLGQLASAARAQAKMLDFETAKLVLVIDQLEELFTSERFTAPERRRFIDVVHGFARSGAVWVVATMRKDFWHHADAVPELVRLAEGSGQVDLLPPTPAQIGQMIRKPAEAAGIAFEILHEARGAARSGIALNDAIAEEVAREPGALPLLSYLLDQLYRKDVLEAGGRELSFATYENLGRLEGAIATKAEEVIARCRGEDRAALGAVLFSLVQIGATDEEVERPVARRVALSAFPPGTPRRRLIDAFLDQDARLLLSDAGADGTATVRVAHEALLTHWPLAKSLIAEARSDLRLRGRLEQAAAQWSGAAAADRESLLLKAGLPLSEAEDLVARRGEELGQPLRDFVAASAELATREQERRLRRSRQVMFGAIAAAVVFGFLAIFAGYSWHKSQESLQVATASTSALVDSFGIMLPIAKIDEIKTIVGKTRRLIETLTQSAGDTDAAYQKARVLLVLAKLESSSGAIAAMREDAAAAKALLDSIGEVQGDDWHYQHANAYLLLGMSGVLLGQDKAGVESLYKQGIAEIGARIAAQAGDARAPQWKRLLSDLQQSLGDAYVQQFGDPQAAFAAYQASYNVRLALETERHAQLPLDDDPQFARDCAGMAAPPLPPENDDKPDFVHDLVDVANKLGDVAFRLGNNSCALDLFQKARDRMSRLGYWNILWLGDLAVFDVNIGRVQMSEVIEAGDGDGGQRTDDAIGSFRRAKQAFEQALAPDLKSAGHIGGLAWVNDYLGEAMLLKARATHDGVLLAQAAEMLAKGRELRLQIAMLNAEGEASKVESLTDLPASLAVGIENSDANIAWADATKAEWDGDLAAAASKYEAAADKVEATWRRHVKQYALPDRLLLLADLRCDAADDYRKTAKPDLARAQLEKAASVVAAGEKDVDAATFAKAKKQVEDRRGATP